jgi:isopenicillin-N N-acyltransferase-like protein
MFKQINLTSAPTPKARGQLHGQQATTQIGLSLANYTQLFASCGIDWAQACARASALRDAIGALNPAWIDEMDGIADGCGQPPGSIYALNCRTEILPPNYLGAATDDGECTAIGVAPQASVGGDVWLAQNWDWLGVQRDALVRLHTTTANGAAIHTLTEAGMLAKIGYNHAGLAIGLNILRSVADGAQPGVPVHIMLRELLECDSVAQARQRLATAHSIGFGASSNIPCADALGEVVSFELAPAGWAEWPAVNGVMTHTNHFLCDTLSPHQAPMGQSLSSAPRLAAANAQGANGPHDLQTLQQVLRDQSDGLLSICRHPDPALPPQQRVESVAGVIMNVTAKRWWIAPHVPSEVAFEPA